jgi:hypothetical protein
MAQEDQEDTGGQLMTGKEWRAVVRDDPGALGVYLDWCEEQGQPTGELRDLLPSVQAGDPEAVRLLRFKLRLADTIECLAVVKWRFRKPA